MQKALIVFDKSVRKAEGIIDTLSRKGYEVQILTANPKRYFHLKDRGCHVSYVNELIGLEEALKAEDLCFDLIGSLFDSDGHDYSKYNGISFGSLSEFFFIPIMVRKFRYILAVSRCVESVKPDRIFISGGDEFAKTAGAVAKNSGIPTSLMRAGMPWRLFDALKMVWEGRKTGWINTWFKDIVLEWALEVCLVLNGIKQRILKGIPPGEEYRLILTGDMYAGHDMYRHFKGLEGWQLNVCGVDYRLRKKMFKDVFPIEGFFEPAMALKVLKAWVHFLLAWLKMRSDWKFRGRFTFMGVDFWPLIKPTLRRHCLLLFPRLYLDYMVGLKAFGHNPSKSLLVLPFDVMPYTKTLVTAARERGLKSLVVQHGILGAVKGHDKIFADYVAGWGEESVRWYERLGNDPRKIIVTGNPRYDRYFKGTGQKGMDREGILSHLNISPEKKVIVILTSWSSDHLILTGHIAMTNMINAIMKVLSALKLEDAVHVLIKLHPAESFQNYEDEYRRFKEAFPAVSMTKGAIDEILKVADICLATTSTTILEAMFYEKPSVVYFGPVITPVPIIKAFEESGAVLIARSDAGIEEALRRLLFDKVVREGVISNQKKFIERFIWKTDGHSTERVYEAIERLARGNAP